MKLAPSEFWRMTLAEWRAAVDGYADAARGRRREQAWVVSHLLIAAGCDADKVSPAKLLGEKEPKRSILAEVKREARMLKRKAAEREKFLERIRAEREKRGIIESVQETL